MSFKACDYCKTDHPLTEDYWLFQKDSRYPKREPRILCRKRERERIRRWLKSPEGKAKKRLYHQTGQHKEWDRNYRETDGYRARVKERAAYRAERRAPVQMSLGLRKKYKSRRIKKVPYSQMPLEQRLALNIRARVRKHLKQAFKITGYESVKGKSVQLFGCTSVELKRHLESLFTEGMSWSNWGRGRGCWNIDHIIPLAAFDMRDREQRHKANHYSNLRPLWYEENAKKGAALIGSS